MSAADKGDTGNIWLNHDGMLIIYPGPRKNYEAYLKDSEVYTLRSKLLISASTASTALDWDRYNLFIVDVSASTTFSIDNARPDSDFVIVLRKDATGSTYNLTWPASLTWLITPIVSLTTANQEVVLQVSYYNGTFRAGYFTGQVTTLTAPGSAPTGGTIDQVLTKNSATNYDYSWKNVPTPPAPTTFAEKALNLSDLASIPTARTNLGLGTAAQRDVGTSVSNVVEVLTGSKLPALDGSNLTGLPATPSITLLQTHTTTSGTTFTTTGISSTYKQLYIEVEGVSFTSTNALQVALSSDNGTSFGAAVTVSNNLNIASDTLYGSIAINGLQLNYSSGLSAAVHPLVTINGSVSILWATAVLAFVATVTGPINAIRFTGTSGGTFDAGTIRVYGIK